jgi:hypothetical protein
MKDIIMRRLLLSLALFAVACGGKDATQMSVLLVEVDAPNLSGIVGLNVVFANGGTTESRRYPSTTSAVPLRFRTSLSATLPTSRTGEVAIAIDGVDANSVVVARGAGVAVLVPGGQATAIVTLTALVQLDAGATTDAPANIVDALPPSASATATSTGAASATRTASSTATATAVLSSSSTAVNSTTSTGSRTSTAGTATATASATLPPTNSQTVTGTAAGTSTLITTVNFKQGKAEGAMTGWGWASMGALDSVTSPTCGPSKLPLSTQEPCMVGFNWSSIDALCMSGQLPALPDPPTAADFLANWGMSVGVDATDPRGGSVSAAFTAMGVTFTGTPTTGLRIHLHRIGDPDDKMYCHDGIISGVSYLLSSFNTACWDSSGTPFNPAADRFDRLTFAVTSSSVARTVSDLCLTGISFK